MRAEALLLEVNCVEVNLNKREQFVEQVRFSSGKIQVKQAHFPSLPNIPRRIP